MMVICITVLCILQILYTLFVKSTFRFVYLMFLFYCTQRMIKSCSIKRLLTYILSRFPTVVWISNNEVHNTCRFKDYDGEMLEEFINLQQQVPDAYYQALLKNDVSMTDLIRINCAIKRLFDPESVVDRARWHWQGAAKVISPFNIFAVFFRCVISPLKVVDKLQFLTFIMPPPL